MSRNPGRGSCSGPNEQFVKDWLEIMKVPANGIRSVLDSWERLKARNAKSEARIKLARFSRAFYGDLTRQSGVLGARLFAPLEGE